MSLSARVQREFEAALAALRAHDAGCAQCKPGPDAEQGPDVEPCAEGARLRRAVLRTAPRNWRDR